MPTTLGNWGKLVPFTGSRMTSSVEKDSVLLETAVLGWSDACEPTSEMFSDRYFSSSGGLSESRYVFLEQNDLEQRFRNLGVRNCFTIAETGFGTGLNFLATAQVWQRQRSSAWLHFVSFERYPLAQPDLERAHARWPELADLAELLQAQYPEAVRGLHRLVWPELRIRLTLWFGDAAEGLDAFPFIADAWFLDGFNPSSNPALWNDDLYRAVANHSAEGSTLSTFTVAGAVRRGLGAVGFDVVKVPGHKPKREMTRATFRETPRTGSTHAGVPRRVVIVGAGISGCLLAANLADRGSDVTIVEAGPGPANAASGNPQGALYVKLAVDYTPQSQLALMALLFAQRFYDSAQARMNGIRFWHPTGLLQLATDATELDRQARFLQRNRYPQKFMQAVSARTASELAGLATDHGGLYFPRSGWLSPPALCQALCDHPNIRLFTNMSMREFGAEPGAHWVDLEPTSDSAAYLAQATDARRTRLTADQLILCTGASPVLKGLGLPIKPIRGQVSWWPVGVLPSPECVVCGDGYINPSDTTHQTLGATFDLHDDFPGVRGEDHQRNLSSVAAWLPDLQRLDNAAAYLAQGRTSFRCTTPDYQPIAGALDYDDREKPSEPNRVSASGGDHEAERKVAAEREVAVLAGLGSKGLALAPLLAEWLSDHLCGEPPALPQALTEKVLPSRFRDRQARRMAPHNGQ